MDHAASIQRALEVVYQTIQPLKLPWMVGGSVGLQLRGLPIEKQPRDVDVYIDETHMQMIHLALQDYALHQPVFSKTAIYQSTLGHYQIETIQVEIVGSFCVHARDCRYEVKVDEYANRFLTFTSLPSHIEIPLMPLAHEYVFNLLRQRPDRYAPIAEMIQSNWLDHQPTMNYILQHNEWSPEILLQMKNDLGQQQSAWQLG